MDYIRIDNDEWADLDTIYGVLEYSKPQDSTGVSLVLENCKTKEITKRVVAYHQIVWIENRES